VSARGEDVLINLIWASFLITVTVCAAAVMIAVWHHRGDR